MNSPIHVQLVKWSIPAVAFATAFFWYKRRRINRAELQWNDPGGVVESNREEETISSDTKEIDTSLHGSGVQEEMSQSSNGCCYTRHEEPTRVSRKVSESMDIPMRNSTSHSSFRSNSQIACNDVDTTCQMDVQLGSNPNTSYFEMIARSQSRAEADNNVDNRARIFQDVADEKEQALHRETEPSGQNYTADECNYGENEQQAEEHAVRTEGQEVDERDSANHSPVSGVLEGSVTDEARSEGSNTDSGKGGSINGCRKNSASSTYDFAIPQHLVGRLIGRHGCFLQSIRTKADVGIYVNDHPCNGDHKICSIRGSVEGIDVALKMIRQKFPEKRFPQVTLEEIPLVSTVNELPYNSLNIALIRSLSLVDGVSNDINISHIVKPNWFFVHLPTHPTYPLLQNLEDNMTYWYNNTNLPPILNILNKGDYVAVYWSNKWVRGCIEKPDPSGARNIVRLVDHGGYWLLGNSLFKPLIVDFLDLPFQAIEIFLANVQPKNGKWTSAAYNSVQGYFSNGIVQAQIAGHMANNVYTNIYVIFHNYGIISLADDLLSKGHAEHVEWEHMKAETIESICPKEL